MAHLRIGMLLLIAVSLCSAKQPKLLTDEEARTLVVKHAMRSPDTPVCAETLRREHLEDDLFNLLPDKIVDGQLNHPVCVYWVTGVSCYRVITKPDGTKELESRGVVDDFWSPHAAVDRRTKRVYWFEGDTAVAEMARLFRDFKVQVTDDRQASSVVRLHKRLVKSGLERDAAFESELKYAAELNFRPAFSPYNRNRKWEEKFQSWWTKFRQDIPNLSYEEKTDKAAGGFLLSGIGYRGYEFDLPRVDEPAKGIPAVIRWKLLVRRDGKVEEQQPEVIFEYAP